MKQNKQTNKCKEKNTVFQQCINKTFSKMQQNWILREKGREVYELQLTGKRHKEDQASIHNNDPVSKEMKVLHEAERPKLNPEPESHAQISTLDVA